MYITVQNKFKLTPKALKGKKLFMLPIHLSQHRFGSTESALDEYLTEHYKCGLLKMCEKLLQESSFVSSDNLEEVTVLFNDPEQDKLATIITFGVDSLLGSSILVDMLK